VHVCGVETSVRGCGVGISFPMRTNQLARARGGERRERRPRAIVRCTDSIKATARDERFTGPGL